MAYTNYQIEKPDPGDSAVEVFDDTKDNFNAILHMIMGGAVENWDSSPTIGAGSAQQPDSIEFTYNADSAPNERMVQIQLTWGTTGPSENQVTQAIFRYSINSGTAYDIIKTAAFAYSEAGAVPTVTWT